MKYKALLCDVDGTLIPNRQDGMPSKKVIAAINSVSKKFPIGIATARSYWQVAHILDSIHFTSPCIITGGAQVIDPQTRKAFVEKNISTENIITIAKIGSHMGINFQVANREGEYPFSESSVPEKALDMYTQALAEPKAEEFMRLISHISTVSVHKTLAWGGDMVHITVTHPQASKQDAILDVAKILKISTKEIIGVGEGYNDFPFLMACGLKVAMDNAVPEVKAIADYVAPSIENDGLVDVIKKFIL